MSPPRMRTVRGRITVVQEERFRLVTDSGQGFLLTLAHNANVSAADLRRFHENNMPVRVEYEGEPNMVSGVAHRVETPAIGGQRSDGNSSMAWNRR